MIAREVIQASWAELCLLLACSPSLPSKSSLSVTGLCTDCTDGVNPGSHEAEVPGEILFHGCTKGYGILWGRFGLEVFSGEPETLVPRPVIVFYAGTNGHLGQGL